MNKWNDIAKRILKAELVKKGLSNSDLANMLSDIGIIETKASIDSKISRGTFSASFLLQCLHVIGCHKIEIEDYDNQLHLVAAEPSVEYKKENHGK